MKYSCLLKILFERFEKVDINDTYYVFIKLTLSNEFDESFFNESVYSNQVLNTNKNTSISLLWAPSSIKLIFSSY